MLLDVQQSVILQLLIVPPAIISLFQQYDDLIQPISLLPDTLLTILSRNPKKFYVYSRKLIAFNGVI